MQRRYGRGRGESVGGLERNKREKDLKFYLNDGGLFLMYSKALVMYSGIAGGWGRRSPDGRKPFSSAT